MIIVLFLITIFITLVAGGITGYAMHITSLVSGEKLLTLNSRLGYQYATTYHSWQIAAGVAAGVAVLAWVVFILVLIKHHNKKKKNRLQSKA